VEGFLSGWLEAEEKKNMPVQETPLPSEVSTEFFESLEDFLSEETEPLARLNARRAAIEGVPLYLSGLNDLEAGGLLAAAQRTGWRVFLPAGGDTVAGDVIADAAGFRLAMLSRGAELERVIERVKSLRNDPRFAGDQYEVRLLRVAGLLLEAVWFHGTGQGGDWLCPVLGGPIEDDPILSPVIGGPTPAEPQLYGYGQLEPVLRRLSTGFRGFE
jgi:hypothetical protein